jgi:hypothetical protein
MMFAQAGNVDVSDKDHLVMVLCENGIINHICVVSLLVFGEVNYWRGWGGEARKGKWGGKG